MGCAQPCGIPAGAGSDPANVNTFRQKKKKEEEMELLTKIFIAYLEKF